MRELLCLAMLFTLTSPSWAEVTFNGFASIVGGITSNDEESYLGFEDNLDFREDTLGALQARAVVDDKTHITAQILARGEEDFEADFEWLYLTYSLTDDTDVLLGRVRTPLYHYSEYLDVGYAYHWIKPPEVFYSILNIRNTEGIRVDHGFYWKAIEGNISLVYGSDEFVDLDGSRIELDNFFSFALHLEHESGFSFGFNFSFSDAVSSINEDLDGLAGALRATGNEEAAGRLEFKDDGGFFTGIFFKYDQPKYFITGEYGEIGPNHVIFSDASAYYLSGGLKLGKFTPHLTYGRQDGRADNGVANLVTNPPFDPAIPAEAQDLAGAVRAVAQAVSVDQRDWILGLRYELTPSTALKFEIIDHTDDLVPSADATLFRIATDVVF